MVAEASAVVSEAALEVVTAGAAAAGASEAEDAAASIAAAEDSAVGEAADAASVAEAAASAVDEAASRGKAASSTCPALPIRNTSASVAISIRRYFDPSPCHKSQMAKFLASLFFISYASTIAFIIHYGCSVCSRKFIILSVISQ